MSDKEPTYQEKKAEGTIEFRATGPNTVAVFEANFSRVNGAKIEDTHYVINLEMFQQDIDKLVEQRGNLEAQIADFQMRYDDAKAAIERDFPSEKKKVG